MPTERLTYADGGLVRPERGLQVTTCMSFFSNLFGRPSRFNIFNRRSPVVTPRRAGMGFGTLAAIAAPFVLRKLMARRRTPAY